MNYTKLHDLLIKRAKDENRKKNTEVYYENHHIIPKCLGGEDVDSNLILLTAREHFLVHWLLTKIYPDDFRIIYAFNSFCLDNRGKRETSRLYKYAREKYIQVLKCNDEWKKKVAKTVKDLIWIKNETECLRVHKDLVNEFIKQGYKKGRTISHRTPHSEETIAKISKGNIGKKHSKESSVLKSQSSKNRIWLYKNDVSKFVKQDEINTWLEEGWKLGRDHQTQFGSNKNKLVINKDGKIKFIKKDILEDYLKVGWKEGSNLVTCPEGPGKYTKMLTWLNKGGTCKRVQKDKMYVFLQNGWKIGRK